VAKKASGRPLTAGGRSLSLKGRGSGGKAKKKSRVWFQAGSNKGQGPGRKGSEVGK
jgi:hypothetical protein